MHLQNGVSGAYGPYLNHWYFHLVYHYISLFYLFLHHFKVFALLRKWSIQIISTKVFMRLNYVIKIFPCWIFSYVPYFIIMGFVCTFFSSCLCLFTSDGVFQESDFYLGHHFYRVLYRYSNYFQIFHMAFSFGLAFELPWRDFPLQWGEGPSLRSSLKASETPAPRLRTLTELWAEPPCGYKCCSPGSYPFLPLKKGGQSGVPLVSPQPERGLSV